MVFCVNALSIVLAVILCLKTSHSNSYVILNNDGPTTLGGSTSFFVEVFYCENGLYEYCYEYLDGKSCDYISGHHFNFSISKWPSSGKQIVKVIVERKNSSYEYCGSDSNQVYITDTIIAELKTIPSENFKVGPVFLSVQVHDPSHMFSSIRYYWDFDDGSYLNNTNLGEKTHNFTEDKTYKVRVQMFAHARGHLYNGTANKDMTFYVDLDPKLIIIAKNASTIKLPPDKSDNKAYVARGYQLVFIVTYNNPYSFVKKVHTQWSFGSSQRFSRPGNSITHTFTKDGHTLVWVTPTFITKQGHPNITIPLPKYVVVEEPITGMKFENKSFTIPSKYFTVNISCRGSGPFKMCWKLYQSSVHGDPLMENCTSPLSQTCRFHINQTISQHGLYILKVTVLNRVGSAYLVEHFSMPKPVPPHHSTGTKTVSAIVPIIACVFVVIILLFIARKIYTIRHRSVLETADFDFRDEDCRSVDSMSMARRWCPSFRFCKKFSKNQEFYPLLESWNTKGSSSSHYSTIL